MKVCLIAEGCYPYVVGGVSSWVHSMIQSFPDVEFSLVAILQAELNGESSLMTAPRT